MRRRGAMICICTELHRTLFCIWFCLWFCTWHEDTAKNIMFINDDRMRWSYRFSAYHHDFQHHDECNLGGQSRGVKKSWQSGWSGIRKSAGFSWLWKLLTLNRPFPDIQPTFQLFVHFKVSQNSTTEMMGTLLSDRDREFRSICPSDGHV